MAIAIYARKSTESEDRQVQSLEDQLHVLHELAQRERLPIDLEIIEARSAKEPGTRPEFERLIQMVRSGQIEGILTWHINRLSRNMVDGGQIAHLLHAGQLQFIRTPERTYRPEDSALLLAIETGVATSFIHDLRRNVKRGMEGKASRGWRPGKAPIGYKNNVVSHEIEPDPERFHIVKRGWDLMEAGGHSIADIFREMQAMCLTGVDRTKPISQSIVYSIFRNEFYCGQFWHAGVLRQGNHIPMISRETFDAVQARLKGVPLHRDPELKHPYAGVFRCAACGCAIVAETKTKHYKKTGRTKKYTYYHCSRARGCKWDSVTSEALDRALGVLHGHLRVHPKLNAWTEVNIAEQLDHLAPDTTASVEVLERAIAKTQERLMRLRDMRLDGELNQEEYLEAKQEAQRALEDQRTEHQRASKWLNEAERSINEKLKIVEERGTWEDKSTSAKRGFLQVLSQNAYLTLEKAIFSLDPALTMLLSIEPRLIGSQSAEITSDNRMILSWQPNQELITNLLSDHKCWLYLELSTGKIELDLPKPVASHDQENTRLAI